MLPTKSLELAAEGVLGQTSHGQTLGRARQPNDSIAAFVDEVDREMKGRAGLGDTSS